MDRSSGNMQLHMLLFRHITLPSRPTEKERQKKEDMAMTQHISILA
jgi:hypothetical protein